MMICIWRLSKSTHLKWCDLKKKIIVAKCKIPMSSVFLINIFLVFILIFKPKCQTITASKCQLVELHCRKGLWRQWLFISFYLCIKRKVIYFNLHYPFLHFIYWIGSYSTMCWDIQFILFQLIELLIKKKKKIHI